MDNRNDLQYLIVPTALGIWLVLAAAAVTILDLTLGDAPQVVLALLGWAILALTTTLAVTKPFNFAGWASAILGIVFYGMVQFALRGLALLPVINTVVFTIGQVGIAVLGTVIARQFTGVTQQLEQNRKLIDELTVKDNTGLVKWQYARESLKNEIARARRWSRHLSLMLLRVVNWDEIVEEHGTQGANALLDDVARITRDMLRTVDTVTRFDNITFGVILPETLDDGARLAAQRVIDSVARRARIALYSGISTFPNDAVTDDKLVTAAETALQVAMTMDRPVVSSNEQLHGSSSEQSVSDLREDLIDRREPANGGTGQLVAPANATAATPGDWRVEPTTPTPPAPQTAQYQSPIEGGLSSFGVSYGDDGGEDEPADYEAVARGEAAVEPSESLAPDDETGDDDIGIAMPTAATEPDNWVAQSPRSNAAFAGSWPSDDEHNGNGSSSGETLGADQPSAFQQQWPGLDQPGTPANRLPQTDQLFRPAANETHRPSYDEDDSMTMIEQPRETEQLLEPEPMRPPPAALNQVTMAFWNGRSRKVLPVSTAVIAPIRNRYKFENGQNGNGKTDAFGTPRADMQLQVLAALYDHEQPVVLTFKGQAATYFDGILKSFDERVVQLANAKVPPSLALPRFAFWMKFGMNTTEQRGQMVSLPALMLPPEVTDRDLRKAYVGRKMLTRFQQWFREAEEWAHAWDATSAEREPSQSNYK